MMKRRAENCKKMEEGNVKTRKSEKNEERM
jgi:hypothetical protein